MGENLSSSGGLDESSSQRPPVKPERPTPRIPLETFLEAQRDPKVREFHRLAKAEDDRLKGEGFVHL
jgi:hypothetical protein